MIKFKDFELLQEKVNPELPDKVSMLIDKFSSLYGEIKRDPWPEIVKKENYGYELLGIRIYVKNRLFRISWKPNQGDPIIIDVWNWEKDNMTVPDISFIGNYEVFSYYSKKILQFLASKKFPYEKGIPVPMLEQEDAAKVRIVPSPPEETEDTAQPESDFEGQEFSIFDELKTLVTMVIEDVNPSLIITGRGGIGKTHTVMSTMKEFGLVKDEDYVVIKGASTALSLYKSLYFNRDKILVFDDCDSIFKDADGVNILKAALDSYDEREISWLSRSTYNPDTDEPSKSREVPSRFLFEGQIIFISNKSMSELDQAVKTRSYTIDISLTENEVLGIMEKNLPKILPGVSMVTKKEVLDFLQEANRKSEETINVRTLIKAIKIRLSGAPNWRELIVKYA
jgi:effector-binding domain-containing protein